MVDVSVKEFTNQRFVVRIVSNETREPTIMYFSCLSIPIRLRWGPDEVSVFLSLLFTLLRVP